MESTFYNTGDVTSIILSLALVLRTSALQQQNLLTLFIHSLAMNPEINHEEPSNHEDIIYYIVATTRDRPHQLSYVPRYKQE
jgi:hypothetical protein